MATFSVTTTFIANTKAKSAEVNQNFTDVLNILKAHHHDPNIYTNASPVTNSGIAPNAKILDTQLNSPITRSGLINDSSIQVVTVPKGGLGLLKVSAGDLPYGSSANVYGILPIGNGGQFLKVDANTLLPSWADISTGKFGGDGSDGALSITSGTTTLDVGTATVFVKNYSSISITSTGKLAFTNPATNGTFTILKSQGAVTLTSSTAPMVDMSAMGGAGGSGGSTNSITSANGSNGSNGVSSILSTNAGVGGTTSGSSGGAALSAVGFLSFTKINKYAQSYVGSGGGGGGVDSTSSGGGNVIGGTGGRGGGGLVIESAGALNFTTASGISVAGQNGGNGSGGNGSRGSAGGGGGSGGFALVLYNTLTAASGTITTSAGTGGTTDPSTMGRTVGGGGGGGSHTAGSSGTASGSINTKTGGDGAAGFSLIIKNTDFT